MDQKSFRNIPLYKRLWHKNPEKLLTKKDLCDGFPHNWLTPELTIALKEKKVLIRSTSGTTSERMQVFLPTNWRQLELNHTFNQHPLLKPCLNPSITRVALTTAICSQTVCFKEDPGPVQRTIGGTLFLNLNQDPNHWEKTDLLRMVMEMNHVSPYFLDADPCYLALFIQKLRQHDLLENWQKPIVATLGYEMATANLRHFFEETLSIAVIDIYGSTELGYFLLEREKDKMELCSREASMELLPLEGRNNIYQLIATCTKNPYMPLIRYQTGDCFRIKGKENGSVQLCGRAKDTYRTSSGKQLFHRHIDDIITGLTQNPDLFVKKCV